MAKNLVLWYLMCSLQDSPKYCNGKKLKIISIAMWSSVIPILIGSHHQTSSIYLPALGSNLSFPFKAAPLCGRQIKWGTYCLYEKEW